MKKSVLFAGVFGMALALGLLAGCSTVPTVKASGSVSYTLLGYVGPSYANYDDAFVAAQQKYPEAQGVVLVTAKADNSLIPVQLALGFYAVKFEAKEGSGGGLPF
jgi:spermidine/putrescine-binding protein